MTPGCAVWRWVLAAAGLALLCAGLPGGVFAQAAVPAVPAASAAPGARAGAGRGGAPACRVLDPDLQSAYAGGCVAGLAQGQGLARGPHGAWYRGQFQAGMKSGHGVKLYPNGDGYAGTWRDDRRDGQGRYEYGAQSPWRGDVYQGGWRDDRMDGRGTYIFYPSGDRFVAQWHAGQTDTVGTTTLTRRKRAYQVLAPVLGHAGVVVCSVTTDGAGPDRVARGTVTSALGDRIQVRLDSPAVLAHSPDPTLNPRWEVMTDWLPCP